jgi:mRNA-degrading endonuclease toxin of MazEF toxin-antitoxin module
MIDKAASLPREKVGQTIGQLEPRTMQTVNKALAAFFGLGGLAQ